MGWNHQLENHNHHRKHMKSMISFRLDSESIVFFLMFPYAQRRPFQVFTTIPQLQIQTCTFYMISWTVCTLDHWDVFTSFPYCLQKKTNKRKDTPTKQRKKQNKTRKIMKNPPGTNSWIVVCPWLCGNPWFSPQRRKRNPRYDHVHRQPPSSQRSRGVSIGNPRISAGGTPEKNQRVTFGICWCGLDVVLWVRGFSWSLWEKYVHKTMNMENMLWKMLDGIWWNKYGTWVSKHLNILKSHWQHGKEWHGHYHKQEDEKTH